MAPRNNVPSSPAASCSRLFLISGLGKISAYDATAGYMASVGVPGYRAARGHRARSVGCRRIILGWKTRLIAAVLAGFTLATGVIFHNNFADQMQMIMFLKNVAIAGGFLVLVANGAGRLSLDRRVAR